MLTKFVPAVAVETLRHISSATVEILPLHLRNLPKIIVFAPLWG